MNKKKLFISIIISFILILCTHSYLSPFYSNYYSYYGTIDSATPNIVSSLLLNGNSLYKDIAVHEGPIFYMIQSLQMIHPYVLLLFDFILLSYSIYLIITHINNKFSLCFLIIPYIATISTGNHIYFYILILSILFYFIKDKPLLHGILLGISIGISPLDSFIIYALTINYIYQNKKDNRYLFFGSLIIIIPLLFYFIINKSLYAYISCMLLDININLSSKILLHKIIKLSPIILLWIISIMNHNQTSLTTFLFILLFIQSFIHDLSWVHYMPIITALIISYSIMNQNHIIYIIISCLIFIIPSINYIHYLTKTNFNADQELITRINEYFDSLDNQEKTLLLYDLPSFYYLETNTLPKSKYFTNQKTYNNNQPIYDNFYQELEQSQEQLLLYRTKGFLSEGVGSFVLVEFCNTNYGNIGIFENIPGYEFEHNHEH